MYVFLICLGYVLKLSRHCILFVWQGTHIVEHQKMGNDHSDSDVKCTELSMTKKAWDWRHLWPSLIATICFTKHDRSFLSHFIFPSPYVMCAVTRYASLSSDTDLLCIMESITYVLFLSGLVCKMWYNFLTGQARTSEENTPMIIFDSCDICVQLFLIGFSWAKFANEFTFRKMYTDCLNAMKTYFNIQRVF